MPLSDFPEMHPGIDGLDDLELFRDGLISQDLLHIPHVPVTYVDAEGVPVASVTRTGRIDWASPRPTRPYEQWHSGPTALVFPIAVVDQPHALHDLPESIATVVVLASMEASRADLRMARIAHQRALKTGIHLVILPLGSEAKQRSAKLNQILEALERLGNVTNYTSANLLPQEPQGPGLVVFFTGLSGSGKSTVARALTNCLIEDFGLEVSLLDGDVLRRHLSQGLTFSVADRNTNVRRIGWVAAEIARHGGIAVASPIAPFDTTRREVRKMVTDRGGYFLLVHVATPVEECERRDRKGLYAKARAGVIPEFTGISSPYEQPTDAELRLDTTTAGVATTRDAVLSELKSRGWLTAPASTSTLNTLC